MVETLENERVIDVRSLSPPERHSCILKIFEEISPGQSLLVVNDHEPVHLLQFMKHERKDFDFSSYRAYQRVPGEWVGIFKKKTKMLAEDQSKVVFTSFEKERVLDEKAFSPVAVFTSNDYKVILVYFKAGQFIPVHTPGTDLVLLVHSGNGEVVAGDKKFDVKPGDMVIVPRGERRGIRAQTDMSVLHLVSPPPSVADHEEVSKKLAEGFFI